MRRAEGLSDEEFRRVLGQALADLKARSPAARASLRQLQSDPSAPPEGLRLYFHSIAGVFPALGLRELGYLAGLSQEMCLRLRQAPALLDLLERNLTEVEDLLAELERVELGPAGERSLRRSGAKPASGVFRLETLAAAEAPLVLVVDDDRASCELVRSCLEGEGFRVSLCSEPERALEIVRVEHPDLAILDVFMPSVDGFELCRRIRARSSQRYMPVVFLSATEALEERVKGLSVGGDDFVQKPFSPAELAARVRSHLQRVATLREMSIRDALTRAYNRGYFEERLRQEVRRAERAGSALSLAIFDIDHFKRVNDQYGHQAGDAVLVQTAQILTAQFRAGDIFSRYGGEEFALILPDTAARDAAATVRRACAQVAGAPLTLSMPERGELNLSLTLSAGVAALRENEEPASLVGRADKQLYAAKAAGRNRVELEPEPR